MKKKISVSTDIIVLVLTAIWISDLNYSNISMIQMVGLGLIVAMVILMIAKLFIKGE